MDDDGGTTSDEDIWGDEEEISWYLKAWL